MTPFAHVLRNRPAVLLCGGAVLLLCLHVTRALMPAPLRPAGPTPPRNQYPITTSTVVPSPSISPPPRLVSDLGQALACGERGDYPAGVALALALPEDRRAAALGSLFAFWTAEAPASAAHAALALADPTARDIAWHAVVSQWALADPAGLAALARDLPAHSARTHALDEAVSHWLAHDADAALAWVDALAATAENDSPRATIATDPALVRARPELAIARAESIRDPALRSRTLGRVVREWRESAPAAAEAYAHRAADIFPSEREDILVGERFTAHP